MTWARRKQALARIWRELRHDRAGFVSLLVLLGFGMIIMPAPPYFEMFTLFYINPNDGVTIMDVISLIVAFTGVYILISTFSKRKGK